MGEDKVSSSLSVTEVVRRNGRCLELIPMDPHFQDISVGLYEKNGLITVWTFSRNLGVEKRIERIRDQLVTLGGFVAVEGTHNQVRSPFGVLYARPLKFLFTQAVEKDPDYRLPTGPISIKDTKTRLFLTVEPVQHEGRWVYEISAEGEAPNIPLRLRAIMMGFVRYGEMKPMGVPRVGFPCGNRYDELVRILLPFSRNISAVEDMMESAAMRGQLTTGTAGFSPL